MTAASARIDEPLGPPQPLANVLRRIASLSALAVESDAATKLLGPMLDACIAHDAGSGALLLKFGYTLPEAGSARGSFSRLVDLQGLASTLGKYRYVRLSELGTGSYAVVYKARNRETGALVAMKKLKNSLLENGFTEQAVREIAMLKALKHANIVELTDIIAATNGSHVYLVLECMDCDLREYLNVCCEASFMPRIKTMVYQILQAIHYAHTNLVMHRDLKPQNILVNKQTGHCKVADFGLARQFLPPFKAYTEKVVTLYYRAPELLLGAPHYSAAVDLWSIGCIMGELINYHVLFQSESEIGLLYCMFEKLGTPTEAHWQEINKTQHFHAEWPKWAGQGMSQLVPRLACEPDGAAGMDLLAGLLRYDPRTRLTARQALAHPWFNDVVQPAAPQPPQQRQQQQ